MSRQRHTHSRDKEKGLALSFICCESLLWDVVVSGRRWRISEMHMAISGRQHVT